MTKEDIYKLQLEITSETSCCVWSDVTDKDYIVSLAYIAGVCHMANAVLELLEDKECAE